MKLPRREYHQPPPRAVPFRSAPVLPQRYWRQLPASPRRTIPTTRYAMLDMGLTTLASDLSSFFDRRNHHACQRHHSEDPESFPQERSPGPLSPSPIPLPTLPCFARCLSSKLKLVELGVAAPHRHQLRVCASLHNFSLVEHEDRVGPIHSREAMGDHNRRAALEEASQAFLHQILCIRVESRGGLIKQDDRRVP